MNSPVDFDSSLALPKMRSYNDAEGMSKNRPWVGLHMKALNVEKGAKRVCRTPVSAAGGLL